MDSEVRVFHATGDLSRGETVFLVSTTQGIFHVIECCFDHYCREATHDTTNDVKRDCIVYDNQGSGMSVDSRTLYVCRVDAEAHIA